MLLILPLILLIFVSLLLLLIHILRPKFAYFWLAAALGSVPLLPLVLYLRQDVPLTLPLMEWKPESFFLLSPTLLLDTISWPFVLALTSLVVSVILTDVVRATQSSWGPWAGGLTMTALGMAAILAGNPLTLLLAWSALDLTELLIFLNQNTNNQSRERIVLSFAIRLGGIVVLIWASMAAHYFGDPLTFTAISPQISPYLLIAAGLRLGVLPFNQPFAEGLSPRRGLGTLVRLIPAAASLVLLARTAASGATQVLAPWLFGLSALASLYAGVSWINARDEIAGRPFWILGTSAFAVGSAVVGEASASLAWSLACIFSGSVLFLASDRHRYLMPIFAVGLFSITTLPLTPTWAGVNLYARHFSISWLLFLTAHALLLAGYARHALRTGKHLSGFERWVYVIYPMGLFLLPVFHFVSVFWSPPPANGLVNRFPSLLASWPSLVVLFLTAGLVFVVYRGFHVPAGIMTWLQRALSFQWFYRLFWRIYHLFGRLVTLTNIILEGEGGILWTLLLLTLLLALLLQAGSGG